MRGQRRILEKLLQRIESYCKGDFIIGGVDALMTFAANVNAYIELFFREPLSEAFSAMHFSWDEMVKGERYQPAAAGAG